MAKINYKSDFDFVVALEGGFPDFSFSGKVTSETSAVSAFTFNCINKKCKNCFDDNGKIHVVCDKHGLPPGKLMLELYAYLPNSLYPDGERTIVCKTPIDIELTRSGCTEPIDVPQVEAIIPYAVVDAFQLAVANGYQGTQEEFYESLNTLSASNEYIDEREVVHRWSAQTANGGKYAVHIGYPRLEVYNGSSSDGFYPVLRPRYSENIPTQLVEPNKEIGLSQLTDMSGMFACLPPKELPEELIAMLGKAPITSDPITSIDLSQLNTTGVTNMEGMFMFYGGTELDLSSFDVSSVTRLGLVAFGSETLETINFSGWQLDVSKVEGSLDEVAFGFYPATWIHPVTFIMRGCNPEFIAMAQQLKENIGDNLTIITD